MLQINRHGQVFFHEYMETTESGSQQKLAEGLI